MSIFNEHNLLFLRDPHGGVEDVQLMHDSGFTMIALNVQKEIPFSEWNLVRQRAAAANVHVVPWCYIWNLDDVRRLCAAQDEWNSPGLLPNPEKQLDLGVFTCQEIADIVGPRDAAYSTECWLFSSVDWEPIAHCPMMLQIFPLEVEAAKRPEDCRKHAHEMGFSCVSMTYGTYDVNGIFPKPEWYDLRTPFQLYTADDMTQWYPHYEIWGPTGEYECCRPLTPIPPLPEELFPYTGPYYPITPYPGSRKRTPDRGKTVKALKIVMNDLGMGRFPDPNNLYGAQLRDALLRWQVKNKFQAPSGNYGKVTWESLRTATADGKYAVHGEALALIQLDEDDQP